MTISWDIIISLIGGMGGIELLKAFVNRKSNSRIAEAQADMSEFETLKNTTIFLQEQLREKEVRFAEQTAVVRQLNTEVISLIKAKGDVELELAMVRCNDTDCPFRTPPTAHTPPKPNITREMYFDARDAKDKEQ